MSHQSNLPHIGFDRFIALDWAACALRVRAGQETSQTLAALIGEKERSEASRKKTRSVLKGLWLAPRSDLAPFADRGVELFGEVDVSAVPALCWGMAISAYPFFGKVAELTGRLTAIQGDCASAEIHRRMAETYGERETAYRAANRVMQTQADWGALGRIDKGRRIIRRLPMTISQDGLIAWLIEAALRYTGKAMSVASLQSSAVLYPFRLDQPLAFVVSRSTALELHADGSRSQMVAMRLP
ncbi:hypothetical protein [Thiohalocapsa marina]|uniref:hypothetical protein n=1 Tax=Thiohalocapsa marina TaxID=424902 RepID=UPI0036DCA471